MSINYDVIEDQRAQSQASKADLLLGSVSLIVDDDGLEPDVDLPGLWDKSASEASDGSDNDDDALFDLSEGPRYTHVPIYSKGAWVQDLIFPNDDEYNSNDDTTSSSSASEPSTDEDDSFEYYETAPESQPYASDDDNSDNSLPCAGACAITVDYSDDDSDPSDLEGSGATIMDLNDDPHLDCCISRPGELGKPLGDCAADRLSGAVYYPGEDSNSPGVSDRQQFCVHCVQNDQHVIINTAQPFDEGVLIDTSLLQCSDFPIDRWYWGNWAEALGHSPREVYHAELLCTDFTPPMETPVEDRVVFCLANRVPPAEDGLGNERRFCCIYRLGEGSYEIRDHHLLLCTYLPVALTEHPQFNVAT